MRYAVYLSLIILTQFPFFSFADETADRLRVAGSTMVSPIAIGFKEYAGKKHPDWNIEVVQNGTPNGIKAFAEGKCDVMMASRFMTQDEYTLCVSNSILPTAHRIAILDLAIIVHPDNPVTNLTLDQLQDIYRGKITNWKELGGKNLPILPVCRDSNSGNYEAFLKMVLENRPPTYSKIEWVGGGGAPRVLVQNKEEAIGFIGHCFIDRTLKTVQINSVPHSIETIRNGSYPLAQNLYFFTSGYPKSGTPAYWLVNHHLTPAGAEMIREIGYIPVTAPK